MTLIHGCLKILHNVNPLMLQIGAGAVTFYVADADHTMTTRRGKEIDAITVIVKTGFYFAWCPNDFDRTMTRLSYCIDYERGLLEDRGVLARTLIVSANALM